MKIEIQITTWLAFLCVPTVPLAAEKIAQNVERIGGSISDADYPAIAIRRGEEGLVITKFMIGANGRVSDCDASSTANIPILEAVTCFIIKERFTFKPARDANGNAIPSTRGQRITWRLPNQKPSLESYSGPSLRSAALEMRYVIQSDGKVTDCIASGTTFDGSDVGKVCAELKWIRPVRDERGLPVAKRVVQKYTVELQPAP